MKTYLDSAMIRMARPTPAGAYTATAGKTGAHPARIVAGGAGSGGRAAANRSKPLCGAVGRSGAASQAARRSLSGPPSLLCTPRAASRDRQPRRSVGDLELSGFLRLCRQAKLASSSSSSSEASSSSGEEAEEESAEGDDDGSVTTTTESECESMVSLRSSGTSSTTRSRRDCDRNGAGKKKPADQPSKGHRTSVAQHSSRRKSEPRETCVSEGLVLMDQPASEVMTDEQRALGQLRPRLCLLPPSRFQPRLTVVLDLDETLVRLREGPMYVRPHAKLLFETLKALPNIEVIIWTCATDKYARRALERVPSAWWHHIISRDGRWYQDHAPAVKNLAWLGRDLDRCIAIDNCPVAVSANPDNCIVVQDIPECLPMVDDTLRYVTEAIAHVVAMHQPVRDALATCPHVSTTVFTVQDEDNDAGDVVQLADDESMILATPHTSPTSDPTIGGFPATPSPERPEPSVFVARSLDYCVPSVVATFGAREQPRIRERHAAEIARLHLRKQQR
jgi:hypothetical protein